jgi:polyferredoxin
VQQLIKPGARSRRRLKLSRAASKWLQRIPGATLVFAYVGLITIPSIDLSSWEPFHAYLFRIAGWGSFALATASLALAAAVPMGYCRLGCPTGRLIDYLRRSALSDRVHSGDFVAISLLVLALVLHRIH